MATIASLKYGEIWLEILVDVPVALVVEDVDQAARVVVDVGVDLRLHVGDRRRVGELSLVGVVAGEHRADRARADGREDGDRDQDDSKNASPLAGRAQVAVRAGPAAAELGTSRGLGGADARVVRPGGAHRGAGAVRQARPAAPGFRALVEAHAGTVECMCEIVS